MLNIISLGAGVQSSYLALRAAEGFFKPMPDAAIFADTGAEPQEVYDWLETQLPFPVYRVERGNLMDDQLKVTTSKDGNTYVRNLIPAFTLNPDGSKGMLRRACTRDYKIHPIERKQKELAGMKRGRKVEGVQVISWQGISTDEIQRARLSTEKWLEIRYPLLEADISRGHCLEWFAENGLNAPKSACIICPYHSDEQWQQLTPKELDRAAAFEKEWQELVKQDTRPGQTKGKIYLHSELKPLKEIDFRTPRQRGQISWLDECEGMCGL